MLSKALITSSRNEYFVCLVAFRITWARSQESIVPFVNNVYNITQVRADFSELYELLCHISISIFCLSGISRVTSFSMFDLNVEIFN